MQTKTQIIFTAEEFKKIRASAIAHKYGCSVDYVRRVLTGNRERKTILSQKILKDALDMLEILKRETIITI